MVYIEFRGYGLLGLLPPVLGLIAFGFAVEGHTFRGAALAATLIIAFLGVALSIAGWKFNRGANRNSLYGLPLWVWGAFYTLLGGVLAGWLGVLVTQTGWKD